MDQPQRTVKRQLLNFRGTKRTVICRTLDMFIESLKASKDIIM